MPGPGPVRIGGGAIGFQPNGFAEIRDGPLVFFLLPEDEPAIVVGSAKILLQPKRFVVIDQRSVEIVLARTSSTAAIMGACIGGVDADSLVEIRERAVHVVL